MPTCATSVTVVAGALRRLIASGAPPCRAAWPITAMFIRPPSRLANVWAGLGKVQGPVPENRARITPTAPPASPSCTAAGATTRQTLAGGPACPVGLGPQWGMGRYAERAPECWEESTRLLVTDMGVATGSLMFVLVRNCSILLRMTLCRSNDEIVSNIVNYIYTYVYIYILIYLYCISATNLLTKTKGSKCSSFLLKFSSHMYICL